jgi:hypothetical protein
MRAILPVMGATGFIVFSEVSLRRPTEFSIWSLATMAWILLIFAGQAFGRLSRRQLHVATPAVAMIAVSSVASLLFIDLVSPRRGFILLFAAVLYLLLEHVRHEAETSSAEEQLWISEFARMVNIGSLFLLASTSLGVTIFLPIPFWIVLAPFTAVALLWSWHLYAACAAHCGRPLPRILLTTLVLVEAFLVALRLPTTMFVGGAIVATVYYLAAHLLTVGETSSISPKLVRRYLIAGIAMVLVVVFSARWK